VDPETDLVPLCANCHAMAHRRRATVTSIDELKALVEKAKG
jgi:putative restriction endonuclease